MFEVVEEGKGRLDNQPAPLGASAKAIFQAAIDSCQPMTAAARALAYPSSERTKAILQDLKSGKFKKVLVTGAGKASVGMAAGALETILGLFPPQTPAVRGLILTKYGHLDSSGTQKSHVKFLEQHKVECAVGGHPVTDKGGLLGTKRLLTLAEEADQDTLVLNLVSGGGSALTSLPRDISLTDLEETVNLLLGCGAPIDRLNVVRRHLTTFQGGRFAATCFPATVLSLLVSDVVGDPHHVIAGGPTAGDPSEVQEAIDTLRDERFGIKTKVPQSVWHALDKAVELGGSDPQAVVKPDDARLGRTVNQIIASNAQALAAAQAAAQDLGFSASILTHRMQGEARYVAQMLCAIARDATAYSPDKQKPRCILVGGETTVTLSPSSSSSLGGRNQEMALAAALELADEPTGLVILCAGTDGGDGPNNPAAGAIASNELCQHPDDIRLAQLHLARNDSYHFFHSSPARQKFHVITGPTGTNVMDIVVMLCP